MIEFNTDEQEDVLQFLITSTHTDIYIYLKLTLRT